MKSFGFCTGKKDYKSVHQGTKKKKKKKYKYSSEAKYFKEG